MIRIRTFLASRRNVALAMGACAALTCGLDVGAHALSHGATRHAAAGRVGTATSKPTSQPGAAAVGQPDPAMPSAPTTATTSYSPSVDDGLSQYTDLLGYGRHVAPAAAGMLHASMVHVEQPIPGISPTLWTDECTGTKVTVAGRIFVLTAAHCLEIPDDQYIGGGAARDESKNVSIGVNLSAVIPSTGPTIRATRVVESQTTDLALLQVDERDPHYASFDALPAVAFDRLLPTSDEAQGQDTVSSSLEVMAPSRVDGAGVYLGETGGESAPTHIVGLRRSGITDTPDRDPCFYGGSGSLAVLADGNIVGPLSWRERTAYYQGESTPLRDDPEPRDGRTAVDDLTAGLGIAPVPFTTVCGYAAVTTAELMEVVRLFPMTPKPKPTLSSSNTPTSSKPTPSSPAVSLTVPSGTSTTSPVQTSAPSPIKSVTALPTTSPSPATSTSEPPSPPATQSRP